MKHATEFIDKIYELLGHIIMACFGGLIAFIYQDNFTFKIFIRIVGGAFFIGIVIGLVLSHLTTLSNTFQWGICAIAGFCVRDILKLLPDFGKGFIQSLIKNMLKDLDKKIK